MLQCVAVVVSLHRASSRPKDIVCCTVLQCVAVCCSVLQRVAGYCSEMQCVVVSCSVVQYDDVYFSCCFYVGP